MCCLNFGRMQVCSHVLAAAEVNGELSLYIKSFKKTKGKQPANMTRVAKGGLPAGAGRKGEKPAKKKQPCLDPHDDGNHVPFSPQSQHLSPCRPYPSLPQSQQPCAFSPCAPHPSMSVYSPFSYFENMNVSSQLPVPHQMPSLEFGSPTTGTEMSTPFRLYILTGNITTSYGCKEQFVCSGPPYDLIVQHEEDRQFFNLKTGALIFKRGNAYYHVYLPCIHVLAFN